MGATVAAHKELLNILSDTNFIISALQDLQVDVRAVGGEVVRARLEARDNTVHLDNRLQNMERKIELMTHANHADVMQGIVDLRRDFKLDSAVVVNNAPARSTCNALQKVFFFRY